ncbi:TPR-REGION domain-containing protein [Mycena kentingensis (nom. inval.)]|nr:TPR-REGION domain-containing protein [Mycena kentingensis (nom. inval.)]
MSQQNSIVDALRLEGNALHKECHYAAAYKKYTEAIDHKPTGNTLAVLYSNRAACSIQRKDYLDAVHDGQQATKADPTFAKGFIRTATAADAVDLWIISLAAWKSALALVRNGDPALRAQCESRIKSVAAAQSKREIEFKNGFFGGYAVQQPNDLPWARSAMLLASNRLPEDSSGHVILEAARNFEEGKQTLKQLQVTTLNGQTLAKPAGSVLIPFVNAILMDERVFHIDTPDFLIKLGQQIEAEISNTRGWSSSGPKDLMKEVLERLEADGWDALRPALTTTVRAWIWRAFMDSKTNMPVRADEYYKRIIEVLEWGAREFGDTPQDQRGAVFLPTFIRGVRNLRLANMIAVYRVEDSAGAGKYTLDNIVQLARDMKQEIESAAPLSANATYTPGFVAAFTKYPMAQALSLIAWYHMQRGIDITRTETDDAVAADTSQVEFVESAKYYRGAADQFPSDDESHLLMLTMALEAQWRGGAPLSITLPLAFRVRDTLPKASSIWKATMHVQLKNTVQQASAFLEFCQGKMVDGTWSKWDSLGPEIYTPAYTRQMEKVGYNAQRDVNGPKAKVGGDDDEDEGVDSDVEGPEESGSESESEAEPAAAGGGGCVLG